MIKTLEDWDANVVYQNYALRESLRRDNGHLKNVRISLACLKAEFAKSTFEAASAASWAWNAITLKGIGVSNMRELGLSVAEHTRNIAGIIASPFVSAEYAADTFLTLGPDETPQTHQTETEIGKLYAVAEGVDHVFRSLGIGYSACSGTVLGMVRSQSFIKGDDDVDLLFEEKHLPQMNYLFDQGVFERMTGIQVFNQKKHTNGWQCYHPAAERPQGKNDVPANYFVDVMPVRQENGRFVFTHDDLRQRFLNDYMTVGELSDLERKPFGPAMLNIPKNALSYVVRAYREQGLKLSYKFASHQVLGGAIANKTSPSHLWALVKGIFETRRRIAVTRPTSYNSEAYEQAKSEIFDRIRRFQEELKVNQQLRDEFQANTIPYKVFVDGVYDLFHQGHARSFEKAVAAAQERSFGRKVVLIVGVAGDKESESYKRMPIMSEHEREKAVGSNPLVNRVISHSPTAGPSKEFLKAEGIDLVLHGNDFNEEKCRQYYGNAIDLGIFGTYPYEPGVSTTELIKSAKENGAFPETFANRTGLSNEELVGRIRGGQNT